MAVNRGAEIVLFCIWPMISQGALFGDFQLAPAYPIERVNLSKASFIWHRNPKSVRVLQKIQDTIH